MQGFIKLHRKIQDHWLYEEKRKFSKYEAWIDLLMMASHKDNKFVHGNELMEVKRGQFITSIRKLGDKWDWSNTKVSSFLDLLKADGMIDYKKDTKKTLVTIVNYGLYHDNESGKKTPIEHEKDTSRTQKHTIKNVEEGTKKVKEDKYIYALFEHYVSKNIIRHQKLTEPMKRSIKARLKDYSFEELKKAIDNYAAVLKSDMHFYSYKHPLADLMRDKDIRKFVDEADPLNNYRNREFKQNRQVVGHDYDPNKDAF